MLIEFFGWCILWTPFTRHTVNFSASWLCSNLAPCLTCLHHLVFIWSWGQVSLPFPKPLWPAPGLWLPPPSLTFTFPNICVIPWSLPSILLYFVYVLPDQQHKNYLGTCQKCRYPGPTPALLSQNSGCGASKSGFNMPSRGIWCSLECENHNSRSWIWGWRRLGLPVYSPGTLAKYAGPFIFWCRWKL